jgi:hypothetical protein
MLEHELAVLVLHAKRSPHGSCQRPCTYFWHLRKSFACLCGIADMGIKAQINQQLGIACMTQ